jgi:hypothetical protein
VTVERASKPLTDQVVVIDEQNAVGHLSLHSGAVFRVTS